MHGEEFTPFSINTGLIFWTLVVFGILLALLWKLGWPALLKAVEERERRIQQQLEEAERARAEAARLLEEHKRLVAAARAEAQELIAQARTVAEKERAALLAQAREQYGQLLEAVAGAVQADERIAVALESPRVSKAVKAALLERALEEVAPPEFVRFLQAVVRRGRQGLLGEIAQQYQALVDVKLNRVHAGVTLLEEPDARLEKEVIERLSQAIGKEGRAHFRADRGILGGVVVRVGDRIYDGSVRRKLATLRRKLIVGEGVFRA